MKTNDGRTLKPDVLEFIRKRAIELFRQGYNRRRVADILGVNRNTVGACVQIYFEHGFCGLKLKKPGRKVGSGRRLSPDQEKTIQKTICDNLPVHHSKPVKAWLAEHLKEIELFCLPSYSPEHNPDEYLNRDLKQSVASKPPARNNNQLLKQITSHMKSIQKLPERVKLYFKNPNVLYAG